MNSGIDSVDRIVQRLRKIRKEYPNKTPKNITGQVRKDMCTLKAAGLSVEQIYDLLDGGWSLPTIRQYVKGIRTAVRGAEGSDETIQVAKEIIESDLPIEKIQEALDLLQTSNLNKVQLDDVVQFLTECKKQSIEPPSMVRLAAELKEMHIYLDDLQAFLEYKSRLDKIGYGISTLEKINEVASKYNAKDLFAAIVDYGTIQAMGAEVKNISAAREALLNEVRSNQAKIDAQSKQLATIQDDLNLYRHLHSIGVNDKLFEHVVAMVKKHGGANTFFAALDKYDSLEHLESRLSELERSCKDAESRRLLLEAKYAKLNNVVAMCDALLNTFKFSIPTIEKLYEVAKSYREPSDVFNALTIYRDLRTLREAIAAKQQAKIKLGSEVAELKRQLTELEGRLDAVKKSLASIPQEMMANLRIGCNAIIKDMDTKCNDVVSRLVQNEEAYYAKYAELQRYEPYFPLLRVIWHASMSPQPNIQQPYLYAGLFLGLAKRICILSRINPYITVGQVFANKYTYIANAPIEAIDLITMAASALGYGTNNGGGGITVA